MTGPADLYRYQATLIPWSTDNPSAWHDGDTFNADIDLGFHVHWRGHVRTAGDNAPEVNKVATKAAGEAAAVYARALADVGDIVYLDSIEFVASDEEDSFGRCLAVVTLADGRDLAALMIAAGQAVPDP